MLKNEITYIGSVEIQPIVINGKKTKTKPIQKYSR